MISVAMLGGGRDAAAYYLDRAADCELADYYAAGDEQPGRWCGHGAAALDLHGPVTGESAGVFSGLLDGRSPDGTLVARPVLRADQRGLVPAAPLVRELQRAAADRGVEVAALFSEPVLADRAEAVVVSVASASARRPATLDARVVADVTAAVGLNPHVLYPPSRKGGGGFAAAFAHGGEKVDVRRCGLDVVVSAPKSVSVLFGVADASLAQTVAAAHERAVDEALGYLERHAAHGLRGHHGGGQRARRVGTAGFIAAAFTHHSSRADDPQLHTHLVLANLLRGEDRQWSAVDSRAVHRHARTAGCVYQAVLRGELTRLLGVEWGPVRKGVAEIVGVPGALRRAFSARREQIECELERTGGGGRRAAQRAAYRTRRAKSHTPDLSLREAWAQRARELGHEPPQLVADVVGRARVPSLPAAEVVAGQLLGPDGLTEKHTSFDRRDVIQALTETLPAGLPITAAQLEAAADRMLRAPDAIRLLDPDLSRGSDPRWTSADLLGTERTALSLATTRTAVPAHDERAAHAVAATGGLSVDQQHLVVALLASSHLVDVVVGPAGSGKTALIRAAGTGWKDLGVPVVGCSLAAVAARRLGAATGLATCSVTRLVAEANRIDPDTGSQSGLAPHTVVVVDEASMVGTRDLTALAQHIAACGGRLVLVGDPAQLPEIDAGGLFAALTRHVAPLTLSTNERQQHGWEREALLALRDGDPDAAVDAYVAHGRVHVGDDQHSARQQLVDAYLAHRISGANAFDLVALASTRRDVSVLNAAIRAGLQRGGLVATAGTTMLTGDGPLELAAGDLVLVTRNDHARQLLNGMRGTVTGASGTELHLTMESGEAVTVPTGWAAEHLDHGYALTVHKAQGLTTGTALVYGTDALDQQAGYVALSRGRVDNHVFTSSASLSRDEPDLDVARFRILDREPPQVRDALADRLGRARRHVLASSQRPYVDDPWRTARRDVHHHTRDGYGIER